MSEAIWKKVGVDIQTALAAALAISAISKASQAVVSYAATASDPAAGDYVLLKDIVGMDQVNNMVVRVLSADANANTFVCEGLDSTLFDTFVSGNMQIITFGQSMSTVMDISGSGGDPKFTPTTTIHSDLDTEASAGFNAVKFTGKSFFKPDNAALIALRAATRSKTPLAIRFRFANGTKVAFYANVAVSMVPGGSAGAAVDTPVVFGALNVPESWAT